MGAFLIHIKRKARTIKIRSMHHRMRFQQRRNSQNKQQSQQQKHNHCFNPQWGRKTIIPFISKEIVYILQNPIFTR